jgi:hypothetical protein
MARRRPDTARFGQRFAWPGGDVARHRNTRRIDVLALALMDFAGLAASQAAHAGTTLATSRRPDPTP